MFGGPKQRILGAFKRLWLAKKKERKRSNVASAADTKALNIVDEEMGQMREAMEKADRNRLKQEERRDYKQATFFRDPT